MAFTALDILVLLTAGIGALLGFSRGFVNETMSLAAWIVAIVAVKLFYAPVSTVLAAPVGTASGAAVLAFAIVFGLTFLAVKLAGNAVGKTTRASLLGPFDRVLGMGFGALKGLIAATLVFLFVSLVFDTLNGKAAPRPGWMTQSRTYPLLRASSAAVVGFVERHRAR